MCGIQSWTNAVLVPFQSLNAENAYAPGGRLSALRSASMLSREVARCSTSEVHALNGKPSAFCRAENKASRDESWLMHHKRLARNVASSCNVIHVFVLTAQKTFTRFIVQLSQGVLSNVAFEINFNFS